MGLTTSIADLHRLVGGLQILDDHLVRLSLLLHRRAWSSSRASCICRKAVRRRPLHRQTRLRNWRPLSLLTPPPPADSPSQAVLQCQDGHEKGSSSTTSPTFTESLIRGFSKYMIGQIPVAPQPERPRRVHEDEPLAAAEIIPQETGLDFDVLAFSISSLNLSSSSSPKDACRSVLQGTLSMAYIDIIY